MQINFKKTFIGFSKTSSRWLLNTDNGRQSLSFILVPFIFVVVYFFFIAPDRYVSEADILVKESGISELNDGFLKGLGFSTVGASSDKQLLESFIRSPNLLQILEDDLKLKAHYSFSRDFIFGLSEKSSFEDYLKFYRKNVTVYSDVSTGLLVLNVHAYSPYFSKTLVDKILVQSEKFINESSQSIARLEMQFALDEIALSQERLKNAKQELMDFQNTYSLVSPESDGESLFTIIFSLEDELAKTEAKLHQAQSYLNENAPQVSVLINKSKALKKEIEAQKLRVTGEPNGDDKLNELSSKYQSLILDVELATTLYKSALSAYELSRVQAAKQLKHLIVTSRPHLAEEALYPKRFYWTLSWAIIFFILWGIYRLLMASLKEHKD